MGEHRRKLQAGMNDAASLELQAAVAELRARVARGDIAGAEALAISCTTPLAASAEAWHLAGIVALQRRDTMQAITRLARATDLSPTDAAAWNNLGTAFSRAARYSDAIDAFRHALKLAPNQAGTTLNLGSALQAEGDLDGAVVAVEAALKLAPDMPEVWNNLGNLYKEQGRLADALHAYDKALELAPTFRVAYSNRLAALKLSVEHDAAALLAAHRGFALRFETEYPGAYRAEEHDADPNRRLRIGYVSPDCHGAVPAFILPVLRAHDPTLFEIYCYYNNPQLPETDTGIAARVRRRIMAGLDDAQVAAQVHADGIDILIDIAGHAGHNRLGVFMQRPAPIQVTWLDYVGTTGLDSIDYRISDAVADPPGEADAAHSERLVRLPDSQWCYEPASDASPVSALPALRNRFITFGSFNNYSKLTDATLALWSRLLAALPNARLLIVGAASGQAQDRVRAAFLSMDTADRLRFLPRLSATAYRAAYAEVDLALDPLPFSGATTTLDALWQGVPVITVPGSTSSSRSSASLLSVARLNEFIAMDAEDYVAIAAHWGSRLPQLAALRMSLRERIAGSALTDAPRFARALENAYRTMWQTWCASIQTN